MAYQKLQVSEGLSVITSSTVRIPDPSTVVVLDIATNKTVGVGSFNTANQLTAVTPSDPKFTSAGIAVGSIIYNTTANVAYTVTGITSDTVLTVTPATVGGANDSFTIYTKPTLGCILYVGGTGDLTVQMASKNGNTSAAAQAANHQITYKNIGNAAFLPTQVVRVDASTTATDIIALW
tara:strand:+ start:401 stop:937 length:537 start_codon:yes stop_codon:yes gene_type:complete